MFTRIVIIVLDSVGIGALPDAGQYGDFGVNTLVNTARSLGGLFLPVLEKLGLGCIAEIQGVSPAQQPLASFGKMAEISHGKDTTTGHWEMAGCPVFTPFPVYPEGFPSEIMDAFSLLTGRKALGNKPASGTAIIEELGALHLQTGYPIVYTSGDSVFQIAAHEEMITLPELYNICRIVREQICVGRHAVGRVIARPFTGATGHFARTANRHDFSVEPFSQTMLDVLKGSGYNVTGVGKIGDIFAQRGLTQSLPTKSNDHGMSILRQLIQKNQQAGLIMVNLVEFDSLYGHRNDPAGYARALTQFDGQLQELIHDLNTDDLLIITADHGCDPTSSGTDHTREYVPLLTFAHGYPGRNLGIRATFADIAATVCDNFSVSRLPYGQSFLSMIMR